jgi:hypothetical protein
MENRAAMKHKTADLTPGNLKHMPLEVKTRSYRYSLLPPSGSDPLLSYILGVLKHEPVPPPLCPEDEWLLFFASLGAPSIPLLYWKLRDLPADFRPPPQIVNWMRTQFLNSRIRSLCVSRQLSEILPLFQSEGIRVLVMKGAALAHSIYPDPALRYSDDIDILVHPDDYFRACGLLERSGYSPEDNLFKFDPANQSHIELGFSYYDRKKKYLPLELHRDLHYCVRFNSRAEIAGLFEHAVRVEGPGFSFEAFHPVEALIHVSLHWALHHPNIFRLIWVYDIFLLARVLDHPSQWTRLQARSVEMHGRLAVERCLRLAQFWTGLRLPAGFDDFSAWPRVDTLEEGMLDHALRWKKNAVSTFKYYWPVASSFSEKARCLIRILFPSRSYMRITCPPSRPWLLPLSYMRRWMKWLHCLKG